MSKPTEKQILAGIKSGRKALQDYSSFYSGMVNDDAMRTMVTIILTAGLEAEPPVPVAKSAKKGKVK